VLLVCLVHQILAHVISHGRVKNLFLDGGTDLKLFYRFGNDLSFSADESVFSNFSNSSLTVS